MSCSTKIFQDITSDCNMPSPGIEAVVYIWNRGEVAITHDGTNYNKVTNLIKETGKTAFKLTGYKKNINCGADAVVNVDTPKRFNHFLSFHGYEFDSDAVKNIDEMDDICAVVEFKEKPTDADGVFVGYGFDCGLFISSDTRRANDANGVRVLEATSLEPNYEKCSQYNVMVADQVSVYAATKAALEELCQVES